MSNKTEEIKVTADNLIEEIKKLIHEGNVRHLVIKNEAGHTIMEIPVSVGIIGILVAPILAAVGALVAYAEKFTIVVVRDGDPTTEETLL